MEVVQHDDSGQRDNLCSILDATDQCSLRFGAYVTLDNADNMTLARDLEQRLEIWAYYSGANAREGLSLDDRLKYHDDIKAAILGLLRMVYLQLGQAISSHDEDVKTDDGTVASRIDETDESVIKERWMNYDGKPWEAVGAAIDTLIELASAIRKSTVSKQGLRWSSHFRRPDDAYLGEMTKLLVRKRFPDARRSLTDQLGYSIFVRRRRLMYQQSHEAKIPYLRHGTSPLPSDNGTVTSRFERRQQPAKSFAVNERRKVSSPFKPQIINPPPPNTELSKINKILLERRARTPTTLSGRSNGSTSCEEREPEYPKYPSFERDEEYCSCPYCFTPLLTAKMKPNWRNHVDQDLEPYVCISEKCMEPLQFFVHDNEWLEHMEKFHDDEWAQNIHTTTWYCDIGHTPAVQFRNEGDFRSHFEDEHKNASGSRVNALLRRKRGRCQREPVVCPLCEQTPGKITHNMGQGDKLSLLFRHIGDHLKSLAFFSLPSLDNENIADGERSSYAAKVSIRGREGNQSGRSMGRHSGNDSDMEAIPLNFRDPAAELLRRDESISSLNESPPLTDKDIKWDTYPGLLKRKDGHEKAPGGTGHSGSHDASHDLTDLYADQGKMVEAEKMYPRAEKASEKALGHEHRSTLGTISNSGLVYKNEGKNRHTERGRYNKILESNQKVVSLYKKNDMVFLKGARGVDPKPFKIYQVLGDAEYKLSRDGKSNRKIYREENLVGNP